MRSLRGIAVGVEVRADMEECPGSSKRCGERELAAVADLERSGPEGSLRGAGRVFGDAVAMIRARTRRRRDRSQEPTHAPR